jgi:ectoine hydroxylase-related dioxygenase (phytanoyl-CoA dioxygenase family)
MWIPLIDVDENNGTITFVKGSHQFINTYRGAGTPEVYSHLLEVATPYLEPIPLKAGEAVFFFHNILHGSTYNHMPHARVCIGLTLTEKNAPLIFYHKAAEEETTDVYAADDTFFLRFLHNQSKIPDGSVLLEKKLIEYKRLSQIEFIEKAEQAKKTA